MIRAGRATSSLRFAPAFVLAWAALVVPAGLAAQEQTGCGLGAGSRRYRSEPDPRGGVVSRFTSPHFECEGDVEIWADSAVAYSYDEMSVLSGSVRYRDPQREMRADNARYFTNVGRLQAEGHVVVTNQEDGSTVENGDLVYLRQTEYRELEEMTFTTGDDGVRPRATVYPKRPPPDATALAPPSGAAPADSISGDPASTDPVSPDSVPAAASPPNRDVGEPLEPAEPEEPQEYVIVGDSLFFRGDSYFNATGSVEITRDSLLAFADGAEYDGTVGELVLEGSARVESSTYDLVGRAITLVSASDGSDEIRARRDAVLTGEDLEVRAPQVVLHLTDGELQRMVAVPLPEADSAATTRPAGEDADSVTTPGQPKATAQDFELTADSLDLSAPGGTLERIFAAGRAHSISNGRAELNVDELPELARHDWMDADTIEVFLVPDSTGAAGGPPEPGDVASDQGYTVDRIVARVRARALYRLVPADSTAVPGVDPPAVSYLLANQITIFMVDGQADRVESEGRVTGWHLEPLARDRAGADAEDDSGGDSDAPASDAPSAGPEPNDGGDAAPPDAYLVPGR